VERALELGGRDNVTVIVLDVLRGGEDGDEGGDEPADALEDTRPKQRS
jgi:serine/threonine protein phosphatase PrpC